MQIWMKINLLPLDRNMESQFIKALIKDFNQQSFQLDHSQICMDTEVDIKTKHKIEI
jgi:hypothetical protein